MNFRSLRLRLMVAGGFAIAFALTVAGAGLALLFERHLTRNLTGDLQLHLSQLASGIDVAEDGQVVVNRPPADPRFAEPLSGLYWQASDDAGQTVRSRSLWDNVLKLPSDEPPVGTLHLHKLGGPLGTQLLAAEQRVRFSALGAPRVVRLAAAADLARVSAAQRAFIADLALALILLAAVLGIAAWVQIRVGLRPLDMIRRGIAEIRAGALSRLPANVPGEVRLLVGEVNSLLDAQERNMARARDRAADLAHGLKTPLAALAADARRLDDKGERALAEDISALVETMCRHVDRELASARARIARPRGWLPATPLRPVVSGLVAAISRGPRGDRVAFENQIGPDLRLPFDGADLTEVMGNLMENAARHARSRVRIQTSGAGIRVEDDGPGVPEADRARILERGQRLDQSGGAGLGLSIVLDVLDAYGWRLELGTSDIGGLAATIAPIDSSN